MSVNNVTNQQAGVSYDKNAIFEALNNKNAKIESLKNGDINYTEITIYDEVSDSYTIHALSDFDQDGKIDGYSMSLLERGKTTRYDDYDFDGKFDLACYDFFNDEDDTVICAVDKGFDGNIDQYYYN